MRKLLLLWLFITLPLIAQVERNNGKIGRYPVESGTPLSNESVVFDTSLNKWVFAASGGYLAITESGDTVYISDELVVGGDVSLPDSSKFIAGTGNDAEIYHDGVHSYFDNSTGNQYIRNTGTGDILIRNGSGGDIQLDNEFAGNILLNTSNVERVRIDASGDVTVQNDLDVTGNVTAPNLAYVNDYTPTSAYSFNGTSDYLEIADDESLNFGTGDFSVGGSVKCDLYAATQRVYANGVIEMQILSTGGIVVLMGDGVNPYYNTYNTLVTSGEQFDFVAVYDRDSDIYLYKNGELVSPSTSTGAIGNIGEVDPTNPLYIGRGISTGFFNGQLSNVRIFNKALSSDEVSTLWNQGLGLDELPDELRISQVGELVTNGDFSDGATNWTVTGSIVGGSAELDFTEYAQQTISSARKGHTYLLEYEVTSVSGTPALKIRDESGFSSSMVATSVNLASTVGVHSQEFICNASGSANSMPLQNLGSGSTIAITNISLKEAGAQLDLVPSTATEERWTDLSLNSNDAINNGADLLAQDRQKLLAQNVNLADGWSVPDGGAKFDGVDDIYTSDAVTYSGNSSFAFYVRPTDFSTFPHLIGGVASSLDYIRFNDDGAYITLEGHTSGSTFDLNYQFETDRAYYIAVVIEDLEAKLYIDGYYVDNVTIDDSEFIFSTLGGIPTGIARQFKGDYFMFRPYNRALSASEVWDRYNQGKPHEYVEPYEYQGASNTDLLSGWDFTSGWTVVSTATIIDQDSYSTTGGGGVRKDYSIVEGKKYLLNIQGSTTSSAFEIRIGNTGSESTIATDFGTYEFIANEYGETVYLRNDDAGTTDITTLEVTQIGEVAHYAPSSVNDDFWYDQSGNSLDATPSGSPTVLNNNKTVANNDVIINGNLYIQAGDSSSVDQDIRVGEAVYSYMDAGDASFTTSSDQDKKENKQELNNLINPLDIAKKVLDVPVYRYNYKPEAFGYIDISTWEDSILVQDSILVDSTYKDTSYYRANSMKVEQAKKNIRALELSKKKHFGFMAQNFNDVFFNEPNKKEIDWQKVSMIQWYMIQGLIKKVANHEKRIKLLEK